MDVVGVVLAGGAGRRIGGDKALAEVGGVPLVLRAAAVLREVTGAAVAVARPDTLLPAGLERWDEPADAPRHPLTGLRHALRRAGGRAVLAVPVDQPLLDAATLRLLLAAPPAPAVLLRAAGRVEPLPVLLAPGVELPAGGPLTGALLALGPHLVGLEDPAPLLNVNDAVGLARAQAAAAVPRRSAT
jgi:molybdopterin-guanine dinucleotide biosynthesis protein A